MAEGGSADDDEKLEFLIEERSMLRTSFSNGFERCQLLCNNNNAFECGSILFVLKYKMKQLQQLDEKIRMLSRKVWAPEDRSEDFEECEKYADDLANLEYSFLQLSCNSKGNVIFGGHEDTTYKGKRDKRKGILRLSDFTGQNAISSASGIHTSDTTVSVTGQGDVAPGISSYEDSGLDKFLIENAVKSDDSSLTPLQRSVIPVILQGRDVFACGLVGSERRTAYLLPIISSLMEEGQAPVVEDYCVEPRCVIIAPTREVVKHIYIEAFTLTDGSAVVPFMACGGLNIRNQLEEILDGHHILVATTGRLKDLVRRRKISFASVRFLVLDEAEFLLSKVFELVLDEIFNHPTMIPKDERQTLLFSSRRNEKFRPVVEEFLKENYVSISEDAQVKMKTPINAASVQHKILEVVGDAKLKTLIDILQKRGKEYTIIFVDNKSKNNTLAKLLIDEKLPAYSTRQFPKSSWQESFRKYQGSGGPIFVTTGKGCANMGIKASFHIIYFDLPRRENEFIRKTFLAGHPGLVTSFYDKYQDVSMAPVLVRILSKAHQEVPDFLTDRHTSNSGSNDLNNGSSNNGCASTSTVLNQCSTSDTAAGSTSNSRYSTNSWADGCFDGEVPSNSPDPTNHCHSSTNDDCTGGNTSDCVGGGSTNNGVVVHKVLEVEIQEEKISLLISILRKEERKPTLVLIENNTKAGVVTNRLTASEIPALTLKHEFRLMAEREYALQEFHAGKVSVLVATIGAAKISDIKGVEHVIYFDLPRHNIDYKSGIERILPAGGLVTTFFHCGLNRGFALHLFKVLSASKQEVPEFLTNLLPRFRRY